MKTVLCAENICRSFGKQTVLKGVSLTIMEQSLVILKGRSGSGKTTLLNILGGLDMPSGGSVTFLGEELGKMSDTKRDALRKKRMGFVFQSVALVPVMSAYENVEFALRLAGYTGNRRARIFELMERVGLAGRLNHMALELSGGEQQRVAIARAIAHHPAVLFADEPTGALDTASGLAVMELFRELVEKEGATIVMTTHDSNLMELADVTYEMADGGRLYD
ncbi:MAG: ABC transporter ATP-binding protein [Blautia sp.]|nr:ABC transporter ATP-binding protein [Blautia sp.]